MATFAEVGFKGNRKDYFTVRDLDLNPGERVIVEVDRGQDLGTVLALGAVAERTCSGSTGCGTPTPSHRILRPAESREIGALAELRKDEERVRTLTRKKVSEHGLRMKVTDAEWQFDRRKLTIYFTADRRVDFRELVRELARDFSTRIELRQIGVRDESAFLGGVGRCGRELCCSTWLPELKAVSLQLAKDQNLSLNPSQISGCCGRLMCCLMYEHETYVQARRRFPRQGRALNTSRGEEQVVDVDILGERVTLKDAEGERRTVGLDDLKAEVRANPRKRPGPGASD